MYYPNSCSTFHGHYGPCVCMPPLPPPPPSRTPMTDQEYVNSFENQIRPLSKKLLIRDVSYELISDVVKESEKLANEMLKLQKNIQKIPDVEWLNQQNALMEKKARIDQQMTNLVEPYFNKLRERVNKINARKEKRKRVRAERKREEKERVKQQEERSRKIDGNLQKIKDEDDRKKEEEESKAEADIILKEVTRKKAIAKKCLAKLDAVLKLRRARQNTAGGRGEDVSERDAESFEGNIEKMKALWLQKLVKYKQVESKLRSELKKGDAQRSGREESQREAENQAKWQMFLHGGAWPQRDFGGDVGEFVRVRSQWDQNISGQGTILPVGWVVPQI